MSILAKENATPITYTGRTRHRSNGKGDAGSTSTPMQMGSKTTHQTVCPWQKHAATRSEIIGRMPLMPCRVRRQATHLMLPGPKSQATMVGKHGKTETMVVGTRNRSGIKRHTHNAPRDMVTGPATQSKQTLYTVGHRTNTDRVG